MPYWYRISIYLDVIGVLYIRTMTVLLTTDRQTSLEKIEMTLELLVAHIKGQNMVGNFDVNKLSEDFFCVVLNHTYELNLENLNKTGKLNYKAIDLGDTSSGITYQITSENNKAKVKKNLTGFEDDKRYTTYPHLRFLILDRTRPQKLDDLKRDIEGFSFDPSTDVRCVKDLLLDINGITDDSRIFEIHNYLLKEVPLLDLLTDANVDSEIVSVVEDIVSRTDHPNTDRDFDYLDTIEKIKLNFQSEEDRDYITTEYRRCLSRFNSIDAILKAYGSDSELVLQSSMADLYDKLNADKSKTKREVFKEMIEQIERSSPTTERHAARRLAIKSLVLFHFEDCTIFDKTPKEKAEIF